MPRPKAAAYCVDALKMPAIGARVVKVEYDTANKAADIYFDDGGEVVVCVAMTSTAPSDSDTEAWQKTVLAHRVANRHMQAGHAGNCEGNQVADIYLHLSNGGATYRVVDNGRGPEFIASLSSFGEMSSEVRIHTPPEGLRRIGEMLLYAAEHGGYSQPSHDSGLEPPPMGDVEQWNWGGQLLQSLARSFAQWQAQNPEKPGVSKAAFDKYDAVALVEALETAFAEFEMWDSLAAWPRVKSTILAEWRQARRHAGQEKTAFNKRDVGALLGALERLMTKNLMGKGLNALERVKRGIVEEWKTVGLPNYHLQKRERKTRPSFRHQHSEHPRERGLRATLIKLAHAQPELRPHLLPLLAHERGSR